MMGNTEAGILKADHLVKTFNGRRVVNDVSISIRKGEIVGLLGPNGAGKSTTFYMIVGRILPESPTRTSRMRKLQRHRVMMPQKMTRRRI